MPALAKTGKLAGAAGLLTLAALGGVGAAYAPLPVFVAVALLFGVGLWTLTRERREARKVAPDDARGRSTAAEKATSLFLLLWWGAMVAPLAAYAPREVGQGAAQATASGSLQNQLLVAAFGAVGMLYLIPAVRRIGVEYRRVMVLWGIYLLWGYATLFWSVSPGITVRNLVAFCLVTLGGLGLGAGFYGARPDGGRRFLRHVTVAGVLSALVVILPLPLHWSEFNPLDPGQRVEISGGFVSFAARPVLVAALALIAASLSGLRRWRSRDGFLVLLLVLPILLLKTRGPLLFALVALALVYLVYGARLRDRVFQAGLALLAVLGAFVAYAGGLVDAAAPFLTRDDAELSMSLTGRVPLWDVLIPYAQERPLTGFGFAAFWNPDQLTVMERLAGFPVVSAHNGFLEELLNTGAVGLALFLAFWLSAMAVAYTKARRGEPLGWIAFTLGVFYLLLNLTSSLMQEYMEIPFVAMFVVLGVMSVAKAPGPTDGRRGSRAGRAAGLPAPRGPAPHAHRRQHEAILKERKR